MTATNALARFSYTSNSSHLIYAFSTRNGLGTFGVRKTFKFRHWKWCYGCCVVCSVREMNSSYLRLAIWLLSPISDSWYAYSLHSPLDARDSFEFESSNRTENRIEMPAVPHHIPLATYLLLYILYIAWMKDAEFQRPPIHRASPMKSKMIRITDRIAWPIISKFVSFGKCFRRRRFHFFFFPWARQA